MKKLMDEPNHRMKLRCWSRVVQNVSQLFGSIFWTKCFAGSLKIPSVLFLVPFKINWNSDSNSFQLERGKFRQFICGVFHACWILFTLCGGHRCKEDEDETQVECVVYKLEFFLQLVAICIFLKLLWMDQEYLESFLNTLPYINIRIARKKMCFMVSLFFILLFYDTYWNELYSLNCNPALTIYFVSTKILNLQLRTIAGYAINGLTIIPRAFPYMMECFCCTLAADLLGMSRNLEMKLKPETDFKEGLLLYSQHREVMRAVNKFSSTMFLMNLLNSMIYFIQAPIIYHIDDTDLFEKVCMPIYIFTTAFTWWCAGEYHAISRRAIKSWIAQKQESADESTPIHEQFQLAALANSLDSDPIALHCSCFLITYGFETSMLGLLISYNIVVLQMGQQKSNSPASPV